MYTMCMASRVTLAPSRQSYLLNLPEYGSSSPPVLTHLQVRTELPIIRIARGLVPRGGCRGAAGAQRSRQY